MKSSTAVPQSTQVSVGMHEGKALAKLAKTYPSVVRMLLEFIQNSIDSGAKKIMVRIDFRNDRSVIVRDDGDGTTVEKMNGALSQVAASIKGQGKLGKWGLGFIAFLDKCGFCTYTSTPRSNASGYHTWEFSCSEIINTEKGISIPLHERPELVFSRSKSGKNAGKEHVWWRSEINVQRLYKDAVLTKLSGAMLTEMVQSRFSAPMRDLGTVIQCLLIQPDGTKEEFVITAKDFAGRRLQETSFVDKSSGATFFKLFLAPKAKSYKGKIVIGELGDPYRFEFAKFVKSCPSEYLPSDSAVQALQSGIFEGEILSTFAKLHPDRESFEVNEALVGFCATLDEWYDKVGHRYVAEENEAHRDALNQQRGIKSLLVISKLLEDPRFASLAQVVRGFKIGSVGTGHTDVDAKKMGEAPKSLSIESAKKGSDAEGGGGEAGERERAEPKAEKLGHVPYTVQGPKGSSRVMVKDNSLGLQFAYDGVSNPGRLWELDDRRGILYFNTFHWLWAQVEKGGDKAVMRFQECIALQALELTLLGDSDARWHAEAVFDKFLEGFVFLLINGDAIAGRHPGRKSSKGATVHHIQNV
jgi:hypothetical protein